MVRGLPEGSGRGLAAPVGSYGFPQNIATPVGSLRVASERLAPSFGFPVGVPFSTFRLRPVPLEIRRFGLSAWLHGPVSGPDATPEGIVSLPAKRFFEV
jgi:hypothetical protein